MSFRVVTLVLFKIMLKLLLIAFVSCASAQLQTFPSFPVATTAAVSNQRPPANNQVPDLTWPLPQPSAAPLPPNQPQTTVPDLVWPQPQTTAAPLPNWPQQTAAPLPPIWQNPPQRPTVNTVPPTTTRIPFQPPRPLPPQNNRPAWRQGTRDSRCPIPDGDFPTFFANPSNCRQYFMCSGGFAFPMSCPPSVTNHVIWNSRVNACEEVENPRC